MARKIEKMQATSAQFSAAPFCAPNGAFVNWVFQFSRRLIRENVKRHPFHDQLTECFNIKQLFFNDNLIAWLHLGTIPGSFDFHIWGHGYLQVLYLVVWMFML